MNKAILMEMKEPSDKVLLKLMKEVAKEVKRKASITKRHISSEVKRLLAEAKKIK